MARAVVVTKKSVTTGQPGLFSVTLNLQYKENDTVLFDQDFTKNHWMGHPPSETTLRMQEKMQKMIDDYKASEVVYNATALNTAVTNLQNNLVV